MRCRPHRRAAPGAPARVPSCAPSRVAQAIATGISSGWLNGRMTSCSPRRSFHRGAGNGWLSAIRQRVAVCDSVIAEPATGGCLRSDRGAGNGWLSAIPLRRSFHRGAGNGWLSAIPRKSPGRRGLEISGAGAMTNANYLIADYHSRTRTRVAGATVFSQAAGRAARPRQ